MSDVSWSGWVSYHQGSWFALPATKYISRVRLQGSYPGRFRSPWPEGAERGQGAMMARCQLGPVRIGIQCQTAAGLSIVSLLIIVTTKTMVVVCRMVIVQSTHFFFVQQYNTNGCILECQRNPAPVIRGRHLVYGRSLPNVLIENAPQTTARKAISSMCTARYNQRRKRKGKLVTCTR